MKHRKLMKHTAGYLIAAIVTATALAGCGRAKERPTIKIATENVFDKYDLALAQIKDVELIKTINNKQNYTQTFPCVIADDI